MKRLLKTTIVLAALAPTCFADAVYDETTGFVTLLKDDKSNGSGGHSLTSAGNWSDLNPPHNDTNYYVKSGWYAYADDGDLEIPAPLYVAGTIVPRSSSKQSATFADLKMLEGGRISYSLLYNLHGNIEVLATDESNPAEFCHSRRAADGMKLYAILSGAKNSCAAFTASYPEYGPFLRIMAGSDWAAFKGTFRIADDSVGMYSNVRSIRLAPSSWDPTRGCT